MRIVLTLVLNAVLLAGMFLASIFLVNAKDASLDPKLQALLDKPVEIPAEAAAGGKFLGAMTDAPADLTGGGPGEPLKVQGFEQNDERGKDSKDRFCSKTSYYCDEPTYRARAEKIKDLLASNRVLVERFDHLLSFPGYGLEVAGADTEEGGKVAGTSHELLRLTRLKLLSITSLIHEGGKETALREIERINRFFSLSLKYPSSEADSMIQVEALREIREFFFSAAKEHADLLAFVSNDLRESFKPSVGYEEFAQNRLRAELRLARERLLVSGASRAELASKQMAAHLPGWAKSVLGTLPLSSMLLRKNETLNQTYALLEGRMSDPCVASERECDDSTPVFNAWSPLRNPIGRSWLQVMQETGANAPSTYQRAHHAFASFAEPI